MKHCGVAIIIVVKSSNCIAMMAQQRRRYSYDLSFKFKAFESAEKTSKELAARQFGVDAHRIGKWRHCVAASSALACHAVHDPSTIYI